MRPECFECRLRELRKRLLCVVVARLGLVDALAEDRRDGRAVIRH